MPNFNPECIWKFNCSLNGSGADDYDFFATWGNLTIHRNNLQYVRITLYYWNEVDGWKTKSKTYIPPNASTSDPYTFYAQLYYSWCKGSGCNSPTYYGKKYKFNTLVEIIYGGNGQQLVIDEYYYDSNSISSNFKYCKTDPLYVEVHPDCTTRLPNC